MRRKTRKLFLLATILLVLGGAIFAVTMSAVGWDFAKLQYGQYTLRVEEINETLEGFQISETTADIRILPLDDGKARVEYYEKENVTLGVVVDDGDLRIRGTDSRKWYEKIFNFETREVRVYLPTGEYQNISVWTDTGDIIVEEGFLFNFIDLKTDTGDVVFKSSARDNLLISMTTGDAYLKNVHALSIDVSATTGDIQAENIRVTERISISTSTGEVECTSVRSASFYAFSDTGDIELTDVVVEGKMEITTFTADVKFDACDAQELYVKTDTGDVEGTLLSEKNFNAITDTGDKRVPFSTTGGKATIQTDTGDIIISIKP